MRRFLSTAALTLSGLLVALAVPGSAGAATATNSGHFTTHKHKHVCSATPAKGTASCDAQVDVKADAVTPDATTSYSAGFTPAQLRKAYNLAGKSTRVDGAGSAIAVVDAFASPNAQADLNAYRRQFGLGTAPLAQYTQTGATLTSSNVGHDVGWGQEEMLDLEMASAACPNCSLIYVGAKSTNLPDLAAAVTTAKNKGAKVISNSYGGPEFSGEAAQGGAYNAASAAKIVVTVSSGDSGYGVQYPAALASVVAVGGTNLTLNADGTRARETAWSGAGSGCSAYIAKPSFQKDTGCARRTVADVSAVADPNTGVAVYDSYGSTGGANWYVFGGTSVAAPLIGGAYAAAGPPSTAPAAATTYAAAASLHDITTGSNGTCSPAYFCTARTGYDGPTGVGTPNGRTGF